MSVRTAGPIGRSKYPSKRPEREPAKNWCPVCNKRPKDPIAAIFCKNFEFHMQANSHGAGVSECGGCGNSEPDKRCLGCLHDFDSRRDNKAGVEPNESN